MIIANLEQLESVTDDQIIVGGRRISISGVNSNNRSIAISSAYAGGTNTSSFTSVRVSTVSNTFVKKIENQFKEMPRPNQDVFSFQD